MNQNSNRPTAAKTIMGMIQERQAFGAGAAAGF
jgi:hypothetical protein